MKWWCVCDKREPDYGAHVVLAANEPDAIKEACRRWYEDEGMGEYADTMVAIEMPIEVTPEHLKRLRFPDDWEPA
jgi:hypothetical protein